MKKIRKALALLLAAVMIAGLSSCGGSDDESGTKLKIVQQYGMAYAPFKIMQEKKLIEKYYNGAEIKWSVLNSGQAINEGFASGDVDIGAMGLAPVITGVTSGVPYKICSNISAQPNRLMTSSKKVKTLKNIGKKKIALVNIGSIQHIILAMAAEKELGDAHALDHNIVAMSHPDGMSALLSGSVECQLTTSPYVYKEATDDSIHEVEGVADAWPNGNSFIVAVASTSLKEKDPELYDAFIKALAEAIDYINNNKEEVAQMLCAEEGVDAETMLEWLNDPACVYSTKTKGVLYMADFMEKNGFLENGGVESLSDLAFDNVEGD